MKRIVEFRHAREAMIDHCTQIEPCPCRDVHVAPPKAIIALTSKKAKARECATNVAGLCDLFRPGDCNLAQTVAIEPF